MNKISYALGLGIGHQLKSMNIEEFSIDDFTQSLPARRKAKKR